jgi:enolase
MNNLTKESFLKLIKEMFSGVQHSRKRIVMIGIDFAKALRAEYGDEKFYAWLNMYEIQCGGECYDYIADFVKEYELCNEKL